MQIDNDHWVTVRYRLFDSDGEPIEDGERELTYLQGGYGAVFPRIEQALAGREPGFHTSLYLPPNDTFGDYDAELVRVAPRSEFPEQLEIGMTFEGLPEDEETAEDEDAADRLFVVTDFTGDVVVLDGNHPLAGMALRFDVRVVDVRAAAPDEIERERARMAAEDESDLDADVELDSHSVSEQADQDDEDSLDAPGRGEGSDDGFSTPRRRDAGRTLH